MGLWRAVFMSPFGVRVRPIQNLCPARSGACPKVVVFRLAAKAPHVKDGWDRLLANVFDELGRHATDDGAGGDILCHHGACGYHGVVADGDTLQDGGVGSHPHVTA